MLSKALGHSLAMGWMMIVDVECYVFWKDLS